MKYRKVAYILVGFFLISGLAGTTYFALRKPKPAAALKTNPIPRAGSNSTAGQASAVQVNPQEMMDVVQKVANSLGNLTPGGTAEAAARERTYVVSYQVAFFRQAPKAKVPEAG